MGASVLGPGEGERLGLGPATVVLKASGDETGGALAVAEVTMAPGVPGAGLHRHEDAHVVVVVLEGVARLRLGAEARELPPGATAVVPPGTAHALANAGDGPARLLVVLAPAGAEDYLREVMARGVVDPGELGRMAARYGIAPAEG